MQGDTLGLEGVRSRAISAGDLVVVLDRLRSSKLKPLRLLSLLGSISVSFYWSVALVESALTFYYYCRRTFVRSPAKPWLIHGGGPFRSGFVYGASSARQRLRADIGYDGRRGAPPNRSDD